MKVLKFGGTSVGKPERMAQVREIISRDNDPKIVVLSAVSGTTNSLVQIGQVLFKKDKAEAQKQIQALYDSYIVFVNNLYPSAEYRAKGMEIVDKQFAVIKNMVDNEFTVVEDRLLLAQGELISTQLFTTYMHQEGDEAELLWALDFMSIDENEEPELDKIAERITAVLKDKPKVPFYITQGFICMNHKNEVDNLKRGGSDYTASLIGAAIQGPEIQIWTDIDGMHNNDPRIVEQTRAIKNISFDEAAELAYFGAKILHPTCIRPAALKSIPVKLLNTMQPEAHGTVISEETEYGTIKAVAAKDEITAIKIKSSRMLLAFGFLRQVFEIFEKYKTSIDMITTSEIAVSLTIDNSTHLKEILADLNLIAEVEVDYNQTIVCIAGQGIAEVKGPGLKIFESLQEIPVRMVSYGGSKNNISVLISSEFKIDALKALNAGLFGL